MNKINRIVTDIEIVNTKIITKVKLANLPDPLDLIVDCGATMTTITPQLFKRLKLDIKEKANVNILGINSTEQSFSTLIPSFTIGGINLGEVRIAIGTMLPEFQDKIILGMNILGWFNFDISISNKLLELRPRFGGNSHIINNGFKEKTPKIALALSELELEKSNVFVK